MKRPDAARNEGRPDIPLRALLYTGVSTDEQSQHGTSLAEQRQRLEAIAQEHGWPVEEVFEDAGVSGKDPERPALGRLLSRLRPGHIVMVTAIDRLARSLRVLLDTVDEIGGAGAYFWSDRERWDTSTPMGRFGLSIVGAVGELERELISQRTAAGRRQRRAQGQWAGGKPPFGYRRGPDGRLVEEPEQADVVRLIFRLFTTERIGLLTLRHRLHALGMRSPAGRAYWKEGRLHDILTDTTYTGRHRTGVPAPALIDEATFTSAQKRLAANRRLHPPKHPATLQGRLLCGVCGSRWHVHRQRQGQTYFCMGRESRSGYAERTGRRCPLPRQPAQVLEAAVLDALRAMLRDPTSFAQTLEASIRELEARHGQLARGVEPIQAELAATNRELERLATDFVRGALPPDKLQALSRDIEARRTALQEQLDALGPDVLAELQRTRRLLAGANDWLAIAHRRAVAGLTADEFTLDPEMAESDELSEFRKGHAQGNELSRLLDNLGAEVVVFQDHVEVCGALSLAGEAVATIDPHPSRAVRGLR